MTENQTSYSSYEQEEEINLVSLMFTVLHRYRLVLAATLICAVVLGAGMGVHTAMSDSVSEDAQASYDTAMADYRKKQANYEAAVRQYDLDIASNEKSQRDTEYSIQNAQEYAENSVLNSLDPYNVWVARADLYVTTNYQIMPGSSYQNPDRTVSVLSAYASLLSNSVTLSEVAEEFGMKERYLRELVTVKSDPDTRLLSITVMSGNETTANSILDAMLDHINSLKENITASVGSHTISTIARNSCSTISTDLRDTKKANSDQLISMQDQLSNLKISRDQLDEQFEATKQEWEAISEPVLETVKLSTTVAKYGLIGALVGFVLACGIVFVQFLAQGKVYSAKELRDTCRLSILGVLTTPAAKKIGKLDRKIRKAEGRPDGSREEEMLRLTAATIATRTPDAKNLLVTGDLPIEQLNGLADTLARSEALAGRKVTAAGSVLTCASTVPEAHAADAIILAADCACSRYELVNDQKEQLHQLGKTILGCIVYE